ncbi:hypothetical protein HYU21_01540 [Candidatus Woesearchaeota archaeon]|nr:hypothetical protein [Candidatus Woesearchaeota archaeon]
MLDTKYEKTLVINNREIKHSGVFSIDELFHLVNKCLVERGYTRQEKKSEETVSPEGRKIYVELRPFKDKTNYIHLVIKIKFYFEGIKDVVKDIEGQKKSLQEGRASILFDAWYMTDWQARWNLNPLVYFLKAVINKFLYSYPQESDAKGELSSDTAYIVGQIRTLLHKYKSPLEALPAEEEVRRAAEEEMGKEETRTEE